MPITVGTVEVHVIPNTQGILGRLRAGILPAANRVGDEAGREMGNRLTQSLQAQITGEGVRIGRRLGEEISQELRRTVRDALPDAIRVSGKVAAAQGRRAGADTGGAFSREMKTRIEAAVRSLPDIKVGANTTEAESDLQALRVRMESLRDKRIGIDIGADEARVEAEALEAELRRLGAISPNIRVQVDTDRAIAQLAAMREQIRLATLRPWEVALEVDGGFGARLRAAVEAAQASLPNINIDATTAPARARLQGLRAELAQLRDVRIGIDMDAGAAQARIDTIRAELALLARNRNIDLDVRVDAQRARTELRAVQAQASLLDRKRINIDVKTGSAMSNIIALAAIMATLVAPPAIGVMAAALGALTAATVTAAVGFGALALVAVPSIMKITSALGAKKAASDAAASADEKAGKSGAQQAVQARQQALQMEAAQQSLTQAYRQAAEQREQALQAVADAEEGVVDARRAVADAERGVVDARRQVALAERTVADARRDVADAEQGVADARARAADRQAQAVAKVGDAERRLASAQEDARITQIDLTQARKDAATQLADLNDRLAGAALDQRAATLRVQQAQLDLNAVLKDRKATQLQRDEARLTYDQAVHHLQEQTKDQARLKEEVAAANKAGVEGSKPVLDARNRIAEADQKIADAAEDLKESQADATKTQVEGARQVAEAQRGVADAQRRVIDEQEKVARSVEGVSDAQRQVVDAEERVAEAHVKVADAQRHVADVAVQTSEQIASAQRGIESAQLSAAAASEQAAGGMDAAATAAAKYERALADMNPATRGTYDAVLRLKDAFKAWSDSLSPTVMPLVTRFVDGLTRSLPTLTPIVLAAAEGVGRLMDRASAGFESEWWTQFKEDFVQAMPAAIEGTGVALGNLFKGLAGIIGAFLPHMDGISSRMQSITGRFANWGADLRGSPEFEQFLSNAGRNAPALGEALSAVARAFAEVSNSLDPFRGPLLDILTGFASAIAWIAREAPALVQWLFMAAVAFRAVSISIALVNAVSLASPWVLLAAAIIAAIGLIVIYWDDIVAAAKWAWEKGIKPVVDAIAAGGRWLWRDALKPAVDGIVAGWQAVAAGAQWMWRTVLSPVFSAVSTAVRVLVAVVLTVLVGPLLVAWSLLAAGATWLWRDVLSPTFSAIATGATWLWNRGLEPVFGAIWSGLQWVGDKATWLWRQVIKPSWDLIATAAVWLWTNGIRPSFQAIWSGLQWVGDKATWLWRQVIRPTFEAIGAGIRWVYDWMIRPALNLAGEALRGLGGWATWLYDKAIKPAFDKIGSVVSTVLNGIERAFDSTKTAVGRTWDGLKAIAEAPVRFVVDHVYTGGIARVWNAVAGVVSLPRLPEVRFARGGIMPGYTPGVDNQIIAVGGGEAILRPELTRALGADWVHSGNYAARTGGVGGARQFLGQAQARYGGAFSWGGIVDSVGDAIAKIPSPGDVVDKLGELARGGLAAAAEQGMRPIRALIDQIPGDGGWAKAARALPTRGIDSLIDKLRGEDEQWNAQVTGLGGLIAGNPGPVLRYAQQFDGTPYLWGGNLPGGFDCSGLVEYAYRNAGNYPIGRTTYDQVKQGERISMASARPGDLVFEHFGGASPSHVGFYLRPGWIYDAPRTGDFVGPSPMANVTEVRRYLSPDLLGGQSPGAGVQRWAPAVAIALDLVGQPQELMSSTLRRMNQESGGDPFAVNRWDSNWQAGHPSVGLMQVIGPTYRAHAGQFRNTGPFEYGVSTAPLPNIYASMRYALSRYGSLASAYDRPGGYSGGGIVPLTYDSGGYLPPGLNLTYNGTGRPEPVMTGPQADALFDGARHDTGGNFTGELRLNSGEFLGMVDGRIRRAEDGFKNRLSMRG